MVKNEEVSCCEVCPICAGIAFGRRMLRGLEEIVPQDFQEHARNAGKEQLLAVRSLIDAAIDRVEQKPKKGAKATKIEVQ